MNLSIQNKPAAGRCKRVFLHAAAALMFTAALFLTGCYSNPSSGSGTETPNRRTFSAKWEITDPDARFASIELTDAEVYIVVEREEKPLAKGRVNAFSGAVTFSKAAPLPKASALQSTPETAKIYTGKYTVSEDSVEVFLIGFGTLQIDLSADEKSAVVKLQLDSDVPPFRNDLSRDYEFNAQKVVEMAFSKNTELICRQWKFVRFLLNGELWEPWKEPEAWAAWEFPKSEPQITNLFSKEGTYLQTLTVDGAEPLTILGQWKWVDENENAFYHTDWKTGNWQTDAVNVTLTETAFAVTEIFNNGDILTTEFELF